MTAPRVNDAKAKRLRISLRALGRPCHICGGAINYGAHHLDPTSFQLDHLWQIANGGPAYEPENCASSHRACNRQRSDTIDAVAIAAAAHYGVTLAPKATDKPKPEPAHAPDGQVCHRCNGTHNPQAGVTFVTARNWWAA